MKTGLTILRVLVVLCSTFSTTAVFGQTTYTWTGAADGTNFGTAGNWTPAGGPPSGVVQDTAQWDGLTTSNLVISYNNPAISSGFGTIGINLLLTANQTNPVQIISPVMFSQNLGLNNVTIDGSSGSLVLGDGSANVLNLIMRPAGGLHDWINDSTNPALIYPNVRWQAGGGSTYTLAFDGTGDWLVTNQLVNDNVPTSIGKPGSGTLFWSGPSIPLAQGNGPIGSPVVINEGTVILKRSGLLTNQAIQNNGATPTLLQYDAASQSQTLGGVISGPMSLKVSNGTLTLSGASTYTGNTTLSGGELVVASPETPGVSGPLGVGGTISFTGGMLGFSVNNTFDYSSRFSPAASQAYSFDTGGQSVPFTKGLTSSGGTLTKLGSGTLTLGGTNTYSGATTVSGGKLVFAGPMTGSGAISVADGAALSVTATGTQVTPGTLNLGSGSGCTLEFNNVNSTTTAPLAVGTLAAAGTVTININGGTIAPGNCYPLLTWTNGSAPTVSLGILNGAVGYLSISGHTLYLCITSVALVWTGVNSGNWTDPNNWTQTGIPITYFDPSPAVFDDTAPGTTTVIVDAPVHPASITVNNSTKTYSITSSGGNNIVGSAKLTKSGTGLLTLAGGANTYTGVTTLNGGTLSVSMLANGGSASDIGAANNGAGNLVLNGGTLQYTGGGAGSDRLFTLGTGGGTLDASGSGPLNLNNAGPVGYVNTGVRALTLTGNNTGDNTLAAALADNGGATSLTKSGAGKWTVTANNTYTGGTTIAAGLLQVGVGGVNGSLGSGNIVDNGALDFNRSGTLTVSGVISGSGLLTVTNGTVILTANNTYSSIANPAATTVIATGATLQLGNGGATGGLDGASGIIDNGTLVFQSTGPHNYVGFNAVISGAGNVSDIGSGAVKAIGNNTYTGWTYIGFGATFQPCEGNQGTLTTSIITNNGTLKLVRQDYGVFGITNNIVGSGKVWKDINNANAGDVTILGTNTYTGGTYIAGGTIVLGDGITPGAGSITGNVMFTNTQNPFDAVKLIEFNRPDNLTFTNLISTAPTLVTGASMSLPANQGAVVQFGPNVLTLTANNTYAGGTIISNGVLQVGNGGTTGAIGTNGVDDEAVLVFNRSDAVTFGGAIIGTGTVAQAGSGTLTLSGTNTLTGATTVSNGTLVASASVGGDLNVRGGTLVAGGVNSVSTLNVAGNLNISAGTGVANLNKSLSPSNSVFSVSGSLNRSGGTLQLLNFGPALLPGDKFAIFNKPVTGGAGMTIVAPGVTFANNLAVDGSVSVVSVAPPPTIAFTVLPGQLNLSWPAIWAGLHLQSQTNLLTKGLGTNWVIVPGTDASNNYLAPLNTANATVFYRLAP